MIYYRLLGRQYDRKPRWTLIENAQNIRDGLAFIAAQMAQFQKQRNAVTWEIGCKIPPYKTPQMKRSGTIETVS